jgi:pimeloyl-ACP methyl ester carboxylesterase
MGALDPDFPDPSAEANWIAEAMNASVVMVENAGHYPQSQQPDVTIGAILRFVSQVGNA